MTAKSTPVVAVSTRRRWAAFLTLLSLAALLPLPAMAQAGDDDIGKAFEYAQLATLSGSTINLNADAVLRSRADTRIPGLEEQRAVAQAALVRAERDYVNSLAGDPQSPVSLNASETRASLLSRIEKIEDQIRDLDPAYWDLVHPEALPLAGLQKLLNADEALLMIVTFEKKSYSFLITREGANWSRDAHYGSAALEADVSAVRAAIRDTLAGATGPGDAMGKASGIYAGLVAPLEDDFKTKRRLLVVTSGPLAALPLGLLPVSPANSPQGTKWLADTHIILSLASVSMLRAQRCLLADQRNRHAGCDEAGAARAPDQAIGSPGRGFLGIGNPVLGKPGPRSTQTVAAPGDWVNRGVANRDVLAQMPSLPGTARELEAAARSFGPAQSKLLVGPAAIERNVRSALATSRPRLISFATHGILASESRGLAEPGLVLTPPDRQGGNAEEDGFLSASEVARLDLARSTIILSACNTGTEERALASRNLNSLARAFQFAGAHNVIASHWAVSDEATAALMGLFLGKISADPDAPLDMAFHDAQRELRRNPRWASPAYWAPFSIIGTGD